MRNWILTRPGILGGRPYVSGTRLTVEFIQGRLAEGATSEDLLESYPQLTREGLAAAKRYVAQVVHKGVLRPGRQGRRLARRDKQPFSIGDDTYSGGDR